MQNQPTKRQSARVQLQNQSLFYMATNHQSSFSTYLSFVWHCSVCTDFLEFPHPAFWNPWKSSAFHAPIFPTSFPQDKQQTIRVVESVVFRCGHWEATLPHMLYWYCLWYCIISKSISHINTKYILGQRHSFSTWHSICAKLLSDTSVRSVTFFCHGKSNSLSCQEPSVCWGGKLSWFTNKRTCLYQTLVVNLTVPLI